MGEGDEDVHVELTEQEQQTVFRTTVFKDVEPTILNKVYNQFSLPTASEGFDEISYDWQVAEACETHLQEYISTMKRALRVEGIVPGEWFKESFEKMSERMKKVRDKHYE